MTPTRIGLRWRLNEFINVCSGFSEVPVDVPRVRWRKVNSGASRRGALVVENL